MAVVTTITISGTNYDVYGLTADPVSDADEYFAARLGATAWTGGTTLQKQQALITAVRMLDRRPTWSGDKTSSSQPLEWPRDDATCDGDAVADGTIPDDIALGEFELALALLEDEAIQDNTGTGSNLKRVRGGPAEVEFFTPTLNTTQDRLFPQVIHELVACYFSGSLGIGPIVKGVDPDNADETSHFDCDDQYGLSEGYP